MLTLQLLPFPTLTTERLILRRITAEDQHEILFLRSDETVMKYINKTKAASLEDALKFVNVVNDALTNNEGITWGISLKDDPKMIGSLGIWRMQKEHYRAEIGYVLHPDHWNKGIVSEAMAAVMDYGFSTMKLHSLEAHINPENIGSRRILEKAGFKQEGYYKENYFFEGKFLDSAVFSKLSSW